MPKVHTHYDNLKVTRNAPPEVIRAAYKSLSQKFHPDRNQQDPGATRTFQIINSAYEVLSDPLRRREHDDWIAQMESSNQDPLQAHPDSAGFGYPYPGAGTGGYPGNPETAAYGRARQAAAGSSNASSASRARSWPDSIRRFRPVTTIRQASGYLFLTAVATLVVLGIMLG